MPETPVTSLIRSAGVTLLTTIGQVIGSAAGAGIEGGKEILKELTHAFIFPLTGKFLLAMTVDAVELGAEQLKPMLANVIATQTGSEELATAVTKAQGFDIFHLSADAIGKYYYDGLKQILETPQDLTPETAAVAASSFLGVNLYTGVTAWLYNFIGDIVSIGHLKQVGALPEMVDRALGLQRLTRFVLGPAAQALIGEPLRDGILAKYTPNKFSLAEVLEIFIQGQQDKDWFNLQMGRLGFSKDMSLSLLNTRAKKFDIKQLKLMFDYGVIDEKLLKQGLQLLGHSPTDADTFLPFVVNERVYHFQEKSAEEAVKLFETGVLTRDDTLVLLQDAKWQPLEIEAALAHADLKKLHKSLKETDILEGLRHKLLTATDAHTHLTGLGYSDTDAQFLVSLEIAKEAPKPPRLHPPHTHTLSISQIGKLYKAKDFSAQQAHDHWKEYGFSDADIADLEKLYAPKA